MPIGSETNLRQCQLPISLLSTFKFGPYLKEIPNQTTNNPVIHIKFTPHEICPELSLNLLIIKKHDLFIVFRKVFVAINDNLLFLTVHNLGFNLILGS